MNRNFKRTSRLPPCSSDKNSTKTACPHLTIYTALTHSRSITFIRRSVDIFLYVCAVPSRTIRRQASITTTMTNPPTLRRRRGKPRSSNILPRCYYYVRWTVSQTDREIRLLEFDRRAIMHMPRYKTPILISPAFVMCFLIAFMHRRPSIHRLFQMPHRQCAVKSATRQ
jgi:hypothetical protein